MSVNYQEVWDEACAAFQVAHAGAKPPMFVVGDAIGLSNEIDYSKPVYQMEGLCGFAWVNVGDGRKPFARWAKAQGYAHKSYYGGMDIWSSKFGERGQSIDRKEAGCRAAADVFRKYGFYASVSSRLD